MRIYKTHFDGAEVDLDDYKTYRGLPKNTEALRQKMFAAIGYYYCYVNFWRKDFFNKNDKQKQRIELLIKNFTENEKDNYKNTLWYQEQIFLFEDETENMC